MIESPAREPIFNAPGATVALVAAILVLHGLREWFVAEDWRLIMDWGFVPLRLLAQWDWDGAVQAAQAMAASGASAKAGSAEQARAALSNYALDLASDGFQSAATLVTHTGLHGSWTHAALNSIWLAAFGSAVNRRFGAGRFIALGLVAAVAGALAQMLMDPTSPLPMIGASGAVSGYTGAMARFAFAPGAPLGAWRASHEEAYGFPAPPLGDIVKNRRALIFVVSWFAINIISGVASAPFGASDSPIAWMAHIGGFLAGFFLFSFLDPVRRARGVDTPQNF